jgi:hypothetical protein
MRGAYRLGSTGFLLFQLFLQCLDGGFLLGDLKPVLIFFVTKPNAGA